MIDLTRVRLDSAESESGERLATLERIVLDLMMEVETLRATVIELSRPQSLNTDVLDNEAGEVPGPHSLYGVKYLSTALLAHSSAGMTSGQEKVLQLFYSTRGAHRETLMLLRLGYTPEQIDIFRQNARDAETWT